VTVSANAETIFEALTTSGGLASFWTSDSRAEPVVGSVARFGFPSGSRLELRVDELDPARRVAWTFLNDILRGPHWTGTTVTWDLRHTDGGATEILFQQGTWPNDLPQTALAGLTYAWAQILRALKGYAETGTPQPVNPGAAR
jgi:uncharacterized protein YndB with AHSA1/START domain